MDLDPQILDGPWTAPVLVLRDGTRVARFLTGPQLAMVLGVHRDSVRRWRRTGAISEASIVVLGPNQYRYDLEGVLSDLENR